MAEEKKADRPKKNPMADAKNFEGTVKTEMEAPHKWNETWGELFFSGVPFEYPERIAYLEDQLKKVGGAVKLPPKYGTGPPMKDIRLTSYKRKKMFRTDAEIELEKEILQQEIANAKEKAAAQAKY
jgi:hypothetical protein